MIHNLSRKLTDFLLSNDVILRDEAEIYVYGFEVGVAAMIDLLIVMIAGIVSRNLSSTITFYLMLVSVRLFSGGYHARTHFRCKTVLILILAVILYLSVIDLPFLVINAFMLFHVITVIRLSPIENSNKPLAENDKRKYHVINLCISTCWWIVALISYFMIKSVAATIAFTGLFISLLMIIEIYRKRG